LVSDRSWFGNFVGDHYPQLLLLKNWSDYGLDQPISRPTDD
jgi:hypothetical protein